MRIVAGRLRGRPLVAPPGDATRPTADRVRQALFDMLLHAPWAGGDLLEGAAVLDAFAGTGALGLEALSRGAARATFIENDRGALAALRANLAALGVADSARVVPADATRPPRADAPCGLIFLDPPYAAPPGRPAAPDPAALDSAGADADRDARRSDRTRARARAAPTVAPEAAGPAVTASDLAPRALAALAAAGWVAPAAVACLEIGRGETPPAPPGWTPLADRAHGAARIVVLRRDAAA